MTHEKFIHVLLLASGHAGIWNRLLRYLEVSVRRDFGKLDKFEKFEQNLVLYLDTIMRFTQNDLFRRIFKHALFPLQPTVTH